MIRHDWDTTWMAVADAVALRSPCSRRQVGAVIVDSQNRIIATGYNGFPSGLTVTSDRVAPTCFGDCPRGQGTSSASVGYDNCLTIHAEANALLFCDLRERVEGTMYITSAVCLTCAKLIANSGIWRVVLRIEERDAHRRPELAVTLLEASDLEVVRWEG